MEAGYPEILLRRMLEIYSPSGHEGEISEFLKQEMTRIGYETRVDDIGNVEGRAGVGRPKVLLCGHMDTVEGFLEVKRKGKVLFGRGAVDAKSPLAALICAGRQHIDEGGHGTMVALCVVDEEGKSRGMKHFISHTKETFDFAIFGEPSSAYAVTVGYKGRLVLVATCKTSPGHASAPQLFENAIYVAMRLVDRLRLLEKKWNNGNDLFEIPTMCVTLMKGGLQDNTVPGNCEVTIDFRVPPKAGIARLKEELIKTIKEFKQEERNADILLEFADENEPFQEDPNSRLVSAFVSSVKEVKGKECRMLRKTGTGDVNDFVKKFKTSSVVYGPGNSKLDHTPLENVSVEEFYDSIGVLKRVLKKLEDA